MSQNEPQNQRRKSGPLEVVSEEQADGSFEIKFQSKEHDTPAPMDSKPKVEPVKPIGDGGGPAAYIGLLAVVALLGVGAWLLFFSPRGNEREPPLVADEIDERLATPAEAAGGEDESSAEGMQRPSSLRQLNRPRRQNVQRTLLRPQDGNLNLNRSTPLRVDPVNRRLLDRPSPTPGVDRGIDRTSLSPTIEERDGNRARLRQMNEGRRSDDPGTTGNRRRRRPDSPQPTAADEVIEPPELDESTVVVEEELPTSEEEVDDYVDDRELEEYEPAWDEEEEIDDEDDDEFDDDEFDDDEFDDDEFDDDEFDDDEFDDDEFDDDEFDDEEEGFEDEYEDEYY